MYMPYDGCMIRLLQHSPQAAPLLKETLNDISWKDLEALRKLDAGMSRHTPPTTVNAPPQTTFWTQQLHMACSPQSRYQAPQNHAV